MSFTIFQILVILVAIAFFINTTAKFLKGEHGQTIFKFILSIFVWGSVAIFALFPQAGLLLSTSFGLGNNLNTLIFIGFVVVFAILFKFMNALERTERTLSEIVRKEALKEIREGADF